MYASMYKSATWATLQPIQPICKGNFKLSEHGYAENATWQLCGSDKTGGPKG